MKTANILLIVFLVSIINFSVTLFAQQDSVSMQQKILESEDTDQILIGKSRSYIYKQLKSGNVDEACKAYNFAKDKYNDEKMPAFYLFEYYNGFSMWQI